MRGVGSNFGITADSLINAVYEGHFREGRVLDEIKHRFGRNLPTMDELKEKRAKEATDKTTQLAQASVELNNMAAQAAIRSADASECSASEAGKANEIAGRALRVSWLNLILALAALFVSALAVVISVRK